MPADNKWFARLLVVAAIVVAMEKLDLAYPTVDAEQKKELQAIREARAARSRSWTTTDLDPAGGRLNRSARSPRPPCFPETRSVATRYLTVRISRKSTASGDRPFRGCLSSVSPFSFPATAQASSQCQGRSRRTIPSAVIEVRICCEALCVRVNCLPHSAAIFPLPRGVPSASKCKTALKRRCPSGLSLPVAATVAWTKSEKARLVVASAGNSCGSASIAARSSTARIAHCSRTAALNSTGETSGCARSNLRSIRARKTGLIAPTGSSASAASRI